MASQLAYNPDDPLQQGFLAALEGGSSYSPNGSGNPFGFSSGEWASLASTYGLNPSSASDQAEGAWYLAQQDYATSTGGGSLEGALESGQYSSVQSALANLWPAVQGNQSEPQGLSSALGTDISQFTANAASPASGASADSPAAPASGIAGLFQRGGLLLVGGVVIAVAIWALFKKETGK